MSAASSRRIVENERVVVTEWSFEPGDSTGPHRHELDYVVVPLVDGAVRLDTPDGTTTTDVPGGVPYFRPAGTEHDVTNVGAAPYRFIEIELR